MSQRHRIHRGLRIEELEPRIAPATFTVLNNADSGAGSLRQAILDANAAAGADDIQFDAGLSGQTITLTTGQLSITDALTITGLGAANLTVNGNNASRIFNVDDGTGAQIAVTLSGLTLRNGNAGGASGGAIYNREVLTVQACTITTNTAGDGGGIFNGGGTTTVDASTISANTTTGYGGGIFNSGGTMTVDASTISANTAGDGGGIYNAGGGTATATVNASTISANTAAWGGGGIYSTDILNVTNSTVSGNTANVNGGGLFVSNTTTLNNSTIANNTADNDNSGTGDGGGICVWFATVTLASTIVGDNLDRGGQANDIFGTATATFSLIENTAGWTPGAGSANNVTGVDAMVGPLANNGGPTQTHALLAGSPAINAGSNPLGLTNDQRGAPFVRVYNGQADIGAFEAQVAPFALVVDTLVDENDADYSLGDLSLREAIAVANGSIGADTITFDSGLSGGTITLTLGQLAISDGVTITGLGAANLAVSGNDASRIFNVDDGTGAQIAVTLSGLTLTNGNTAGGFGGAIWSQENLTIQACVITGNSASQLGGGIYNGGGTVTVNSSTISGNTAVGFFDGRGGGIFNDHGTLTVNSSTISGNTAAGFMANGNGGGICTWDGTLTVNSSTISGNTVGWSGGGIFIDSGTVTVNSSTISGNTADLDGGGILIDSGTVTVNSSTISGNTAGFFNGGGVYILGGTMTVNSSTISGNTGGRDGGGIYIWAGTATVNSSTISGNAAGLDGGGVYNEATFNLTNSTVSGNTANINGG
ncbi:MAG: choice-of-anchor Q domain-containing protein, partial [Planctomycetota bacterium]